MLHQCGNTQPAEKCSLLCVSWCAGLHAHAGWQCVQALPAFSNGLYVCHACVHRFLTCQQATCSQCSCTRAADQLGNRKRVGHMSLKHKICIQHAVQCSNTMTHMAFIQSINPPFLILGLIRGVDRHQLGKQHTLSTKCSRRPTL